MNGHEWAKRQADHEDLTYRALANGFAGCEDPARLQVICDCFGPDDLQGFFDRWITAIPTPLSAADRAAGYWWELSMRQIEVTRTLVFDDPRRARRFFESLVADNVAIGRPETGLDGVRPPGHQGHQGTVPRTDLHRRHRCPARLLLQAQPGQAVHERREGSADRDRDQQTRDLGLRSRICHLPELIDKARQVNDRLLTIERAGQGCAIGSALFERIHQPYAREGQRTGALRFGDVRAMALVGALCMLVPAVTGITNAEPSRAGGRTPRHDYARNQMSYDLRRLRLHDIIERLAGTNTYRVTNDGIRVAVFYTKVRARMLGPMLDADQPPHQSSFDAPCRPSTARSRTTSPMPASGSPHESCHNVKSLE